MFLKTIPDPYESKGECSFCGGLGHKINNCTKFENQRSKSIISIHIANKELNS